jgi:hypothetical protein
VHDTGHQTCTLDADPATGLCTYRFVAGDLPDAGGDYECDLQLTDPAGPVETYYSKNRIKSRAENRFVGLGYAYKLRGWTS